MVREACQSERAPHKATVTQRLAPIVKPEKKDFRKYPFETMG
jgi:hypothetical protein